jgi:DNA helicase HerA-like ATPase
MNWASLKVKRNNRAFVAGMTGSGKTTLARYLLEDAEKLHSVIYDLKYDSAIEQWKRHKIYYDFEALQDARENRLVYRPPITHETNRDAQDAFFAWVYHREYTRLYIDEGYALIGGSNPSMYLKALLSRGRSRGISTILSVQRPVSLPLLTISESEQVYLFRLGLPEDRKRMAEFTGIDERDQARLQPYQFYYWSITGGARGPLKLKLR